MKQRAQSILFFFSAVLFGLLFFMPLALYLDDYGTYYKLYVYGVNVVSVAPNMDVAFSGLRQLPFAPFVQGCNFRENEQVGLTGV